MSVARQDDRGADRHVVLLGLPGAGGPNVGRHVAGLLQRPFADLDEQLELTAGCTIPRLVSERGADELGRWRERILAGLLGRDSALVVTAAGPIEIGRETRARLAQSAVALWTRGALRPEAEPGVVARRPGRGELVDELSALYQDLADHVVNLEPFHPLADPDRAVAHHILQVLTAGDLRGSVRTPDDTRRSPDLDGDDAPVTGRREPDPSPLYEQVADLTVDVEPFQALDDPERAMASHILRLLARDTRPTER